MCRQYLRNISRSPLQIDPIGLISPDEQSYFVIYPRRLQVSSICRRFAWIIGTIHRRLRSREPTIPRVVQKPRDRVVRINTTRPCADVLVHSAALDFHAIHRPATSMKQGHERREASVVYFNAKTWQGASSCLEDAEDRAYGAIDNNAGKWKTTSFQIEIK